MGGNAGGGGGSIVSTGVLLGVGVGATSIKSQEFFLFLRVVKSPRDFEIFMDGVTDILYYISL